VDGSSIRDNIDRQQIDAVEILAINGHGVDLIGAVRAANAAVAR
jgi:hypothetical protein